MVSLSDAGEACYAVFTANGELPSFHRYRIDWGSNQSAVFLRPTDQIHAFRGTQPTSLWDWVTDIKIRKKFLDQAAGKWHRGFLDAANMLYSQHTARLAVSGPSRSVWFVGHSLGAAIATSMLAIIAARDPKLLSVIQGVALFGAPRVTNAAGATWLSAKLADHQVPVHRVVARGDLVASVPPYILGYRHIVPETLRLPGRRWATDHSMKRVYLPQLRALPEKELEL